MFQTGLQAGSLTIYAFSRDHGFPDGGFFVRFAAAGAVAAGLFALRLAAEVTVAAPGLGVDCATGGENEEALGVGGVSSGGGDALVGVPDLEPDVRSVGVGMRLLNPDPFKSTSVGVSLRSNE